LSPAPPKPPTVGSGRSPAVDAPGRFEAGALAGPVQHPPVKKVKCKKAKKGASAKAKARAKKKCKRRRNR